MKKLLLVVIALATASAHATKARLTALNQDTNGSFYIIDTRNIFLNPAQLSVMKDYLDFEWGKQSRDGTDSDLADNEGGFALSVGAGKLAVQLGRVGDFDNMVREINGHMTDLATVLTGANNHVAEGQNNVDVIYSGKAGGDMSWGAGIAIERSKNTILNTGRQQDVQAFDVRGGVHADKWEGFGSLILGGHSRTDLGTGQGKLDESFGLHLGGGWQFNNDMRAFAHVTYDQYDASIPNVDYNGKRLSIDGGVAYTRSLEGDAHMFATAELYYLDHSDLSQTTGVDDEKYQLFQLPLTLGVEADATSWARFRASVRQPILIGQGHNTMGATANDNNKYENAPNETSVAAGVGMSAQKFNFDVAVAQSLASDFQHLEVSATYTW